MAHTLKDRVKETTTTIGTGNISFSGASAGFRTFSSAGYSDDDTVYYTVVSGDNWEVGIGTITSSVSGLIRTTILSSSNSGAAISLAGTSEVFVSHPAAKTAHTVPSHIPSVSGVAFWGSESVLGYDNSITWASGDNQLEVLGKIKTKTIYTENKINTDGSTVTFDTDESTLHTVVLGGNRALAVSNPKVGQKFILRLQQDSTGGRVVTWWNHVKWAEGGTAPTLTTTGNKTDILGFIVASGESTNYWYDGVIIGQNV